VLVQGARHQLLARTGFTGDEHRHMALCQTADGAEHVLHGGRLSQHLGRLVKLHVHHFFAQAFVHGAADQLNRFRQVKGLGQVLKGTTGKRRHGAVEVRVRGHDDDRQARHALLDGGQQVQTGAARHADVAHQHLRATLAVVGIERLQHIARTREAARGQAFALQGLLQHEADGLVIVSDPDRLHQQAFSLFRKIIGLMAKESGS